MGFDFGKLYEEKLTIHLWVDGVLTYYIHTLIDEKYKKVPVAKDYGGLGRDILSVSSSIKFHQKRGFLDAVEQPLLRCQSEMEKLFRCKNDRGLCRIDAGISLMGELEGKKIPIVIIPDPNSIPRFSGYSNIPLAIMDFIDQVNIKNYHSSGVLVFKSVFHVDIAGECFRGEWLQFLGVYYLDSTATALVRDHMKLILPN